MEYSENFNFALPSRDNDVDLADINELANNFRKIDEKAVIKEDGKGLSTNDFTNEQKEKVDNSLTAKDIDQKYNPKSENAQSGIAVEEAIKGTANIYANGIKGYASGEIIRVDDVAPVEHPVEVNIRCKNLFSLSNACDVMSTYYSWLVNPERETVTLSLVEKDSSIDISEIYFGFSTSGVDGTDGGIIWLIQNGKINMNKCTANNPYISIFKTQKQNATAIETLAARFDIQVEKGDHATDYEPYIDPTTVTVTGCGRNLFDLQKSQGFYSVYGGITNEIVGDDIVVNCTVPSRGGYLDLGTFPAGTYYFSASEKLSVQKNGTNLGMTPCKVTLTETAKLNLYKGFSSESSPMTISNIQVEYGETQTDYETPNVTRYTPNEDGAIDGVVSKSPNMTVFTDTDGVTIDCEYNKDTNKVVESLVNAIISLGGNV